MVQSLNHVTLAVRDLHVSFSFYTEMLGLRPAARWYKGAYLLAGKDWICLSLDTKCRIEPLPEYTHLAFSVSVEEFASTVTQLREAGVIAWQENHSPGESFYFLDPDGHKLEIPCVNLHSRLESFLKAPPKDLVLFDQ